MKLTLNFLEDLLTKQIKSTQIKKMSLFTTLVMQKLKDPDGNLVKKQSLFIYNQILMKIL